MSVKEDLVEDLTKVSKLDYISPIEISDMIQQLGFKIDTKVL